MAKFKTKMSASQLDAFREVLENILFKWQFDDEEKIFKAALVETLTVVRRKLAVAEYRREYKLSFTEVQAQGVYWMWQKMGKIPITDFTAKLHLIALDIHQQYA